MNYFLHIETATDICSVAISKEKEIVAINEEKDSRKHSEIITLQIEDVLNKSGLNMKDLSAISLSEGPGSYTSLRVGMSAAKAICYAHNLPLISINTLVSLADASNQIIDDKYLICPMIDARRMEVYASLFTSNFTPIFENKPIILDEKSFKEYFDGGYKIIFSGNGSDKFKKVINNSKTYYSNLICSAQNLVKPALNKFTNKLFEDIAYFSPNYIKPPNITKPKFKQL